MLQRVYPIVKFHTSQGWLDFVEPAAVIAAFSLAEVLPALAEVENLVRRGLWAVGFVSYEAAAAFDAACVTRPAVPQLPLVWFALYEEAAPCPAPSAAVRALNWQAELDFGTYAASLVRLREHILKGDIYQANFTQRLTAVADRSALRGLAGQPQAVYGAVIETEAFAIYSASPELFFECAGGRIVCRPMKGTAPRGATPAADASLKAGLAACEKNRAENLMITDLMRNDLGRIASPGTVEVPELFTVETYPGLFQLTSTVTARTCAGLTEIMQALFPCGSITGAPKIRSMQLISALEHSPRGVYTGALGYLAPNGAMRFSVAIRCAQVLGRQAFYGVGGGIVWDSEAEVEWRECRLKAAILGAAALG